MDRSFALCARSSRRPSTRTHDRAGALALAGALIALAQTPAAHAEGALRESPPTVATTAARPLSATAPATAAPAARLGRRFRLSLDASGGYGAYLGLLFVERMHGPIVDASVRGTWSIRGRETVRLGFRLHGAVGPEMRGVLDWIDLEPNADHKEAARGRMWAAHAGPVLELHGAWVSPGLGVLHTEATPDAPDRRGMSWYLPEVSVAGGYLFSLGEHAALSINAEAGTIFTTLRGQITAGVLVRL